MDFQFTPEQEQMRRAFEDFGRREIRPGAAHRDRTGDWDPALYRKCAEMGIIGMPFPAEYGGSNCDLLTTAIALEGLAYGANDQGWILGLTVSMVICGIPIWKFGTEAQRLKYLPKLISGDYIGCFGLTEPNVGSDAASIQTKAHKDGDGYVLNGAKIFISNGPVADVMVAFAQLHDAGGKIGPTAFIVEKGTPGFHCARKLEKMGLASSQTGEMVFDECRIPAENLLGEEGRGFEVATRTLLYERALVFTPKLGEMQNLLDEATRYAQQRVQFGKPIAEYQLIRAKLADMRVDLEATRWQTYHVAWMKDQGMDIKLASSILKLFSSEAQVRAADHAVQIHGGYGYMKEFEVERKYREAKVGTIGGGTSEIQRMIISSYVLKGR